MGLIHRFGVVLRTGLSGLALALVLAAGCSGPAPSTERIAPRGPSGVQADAFPAPSRPVAAIVTDTWSDEETRDRAGEAERVMGLLDVRPGMHVADIGAGSGYYVVRLAPRVGRTGFVIAQDIVPEYLERLRHRLQREQVTNVSYVLGEPHDPRLPPNSVDLALLVHMYHEVEQPYGLLYNLYPALLPGARVAVVDLDRPTQQHGTPPALLRCEFAAVGYHEVAFHELGEGSGYLAVFAPPASRAERIEPAATRSCRTGEPPQARPE
ncbi:MAG TPA: methyltransferase domain-containing protein [Longimicrobiaceae bacterium]|nr:methyltransferase domain-containing protein [Longimicrobiaceae bacterium]